MLIQVAVPVPALDLLTYRVPDDVVRPSVGARVVVPLGARTVTGVVVPLGSRIVTGIVIDIGIDIAIDEAAVGV